MAETDVAGNCSQDLHYPDLPGPGCVVDTNQDEVVVAILIVLLVLVTFYRLIHVWAYTLNFSEASIQGPQGWDIVTNWIVEKLRRTKRSTRWGRRGPAPHVPPPRLPILRVESPSGDTTPVMQTRAVTERPSFLRATSLRSSRESVVDPWMLSLHHIRQARSLREMSSHHQMSDRQSLRSSAPSPRLTRPASASCKSPPASRRIRSHSETERVNLYGQLSA